MSLQAAPSNDQSSLARVEGAMPYVPSAPCAACARGVDPLRAACISVTDSSLHYFCSRVCRASYVQREASLQPVVRPAGMLEQPSDRRASTPPSESRARGTQRASEFHSRAERTPTPARGGSASLEPVARRIAPAKPETPQWPLFASAGCLLVGVLPVTGADQLGVLGMTGVAAVFASRAGLTRRHGGIIAWLQAPLAVALLGLSALLGQPLPAKLGLSFPHGCLVGAALAICVMWWREHLLERAQATETAQRSELAARLSPRARVSTPRSHAQARGSTPGSHAQAPASTPGSHAQAPASTVGSRAPTSRSASEPGRAAPA